MNFVVLPDCPAGAALAGRLRWTRRIDHASGRPWIVGDWSPREVTTAVAGPRQLVLFGPTAVDEQAAARSLDRAGSLAGLDRLTLTLPGLFHLVASRDGQTRVQGSVAGARQVFAVMAGGVSVAASSVTPLLELAGHGSLDETMLAARLLAPAGPPWPLAQRTVRRDVTIVQAGHWLRLDADGGGTQVRWWQLPPATRSLDEAAQALRDALDASLAARLRLNRTITADL